MTSSLLPLSPVRFLTFPLVRLYFQITSNPLSENQVPINDDDDNLLNFDNKTGEVVVRNFSRNWKSGRNELFRRTLFYSDLIGFSTSLELKTCGHTVHMRCFNAYRETLRNDLRVNDSRRSSRDVSCFLCRFSVNALLPLRIDWGFETLHKDTLADDRQKAFDSLKEVIVNWRRVPQVCFW
ncbi:unnamed protein product [Strongylus vulgaris]|uniref:Uncharacterized protein n=1 Tax=Strongylus vulgaris TaxID=40348 RepID=A0A3P7ITZ9_STRVU|nr:unnamed protein product [Strongylus vulgaris]